jgi:NADH:ubiquinone oxidoreductase subunit H
VVWIPLVAGSGALFSNNFLFLLSVRRLRALLVFFSGWGGGRIFSFLGGIRASAQIVSYEVVLSFVFLMSLMGRFTLSFQRVVRLGSGGGSLLIILLPVLITILLAETNRAPFDLTEGESELVRGFNTEFSSTLFVLLFLGEYSFILVFSLLSSIVVMATWGGWWVVRLIIL